LPAFTGFVEMGSLRLAIIDGYEYREGDELEAEGTWSRRYARIR
jgi:hypothetical protein